MHAINRAFAIVALLVPTLWAGAQTTVTSVSQPPLAGTNHFYVANRAPLAPSAFIPLPIGAVQPRGWLQEMLRRQRDGLGGHLGEISVWLEKDDNAWLSPDGKGKYGWEEVPYWLRGYIQLAYLSNDPKMIAEAEIWIHGAMNSQRPNGDFGPDQKFDDDGSRDFWANMLMLFCLETYYEHSHDPRVIDVLTQIFQVSTHRAGGQVPHPLLAEDARRRQSLQRLLALQPHGRSVPAGTGRQDPSLHRQLGNEERPAQLAQREHGGKFPRAGGTLRKTHDRAELQATYADFNEVRKRYGQVPGGMFGADENCRPGYADPVRPSKPAAWWSRCCPMNCSPDQWRPVLGGPLRKRGLQHLSGGAHAGYARPALSHRAQPGGERRKDHSPGIQNGGPFLMMNPFSSRCCQHNFSMGWPYFDKHLWLATPDNGLCAAVYSPSEVTALGRRWYASVTSPSPRTIPLKTPSTWPYHAGSIGNFPAVPAHSRLVRGRHRGGSTANHCRPRPRPANTCAWPVNGRTATPSPSVCP